MAVSSTPIRGLNACRWYAKFFYDPIACIRDSYRTHGLLAAVGNIVPFSKSERLYALAIGPEFNRQILGNPALFCPSGPPRRWGSGRDDSALHRLSYGLTRMTGPKHQQQRRLVMPPFQKKAMDRYCHTIASAMDQLLDDWDTKHTIDMWPRIQALSMNISSRTLFDLENPKAAYALGQMIQDWLTLNYSTGVLVFPVDAPYTPYRRLLKYAERIEREILRMIEKKRTGAAGGHDVLSLLARSRDESNDQMTEAELVGQTTILFGASYETVSSALTWTVFLLAQHPGVMADLVDELHGMLHGGPPTSEQLDKLPLLEAAIKESMRILPPIPFTARKATGPVELGGLQFKRGDRVILGHYMTHHLPVPYANPEEFQPQRWCEIDPDSYAYVPFSAGPRMCIGYNFAMTALKISLSMILQRFRLTVMPGARIDRNVQVSMRPKHGMPMTLHRQDRQFRAVPVTGNIHDMVLLPSIS